MLPAADRPQAADLWLLLQTSPNAAEPQAQRELQQVGATLGEQLDDVRVPIAPPASEIGMWLDEHVFYLLAPAAIADLASKLEPTSIAASVAKIRAELASPIFGVMGSDVRRDPLAIHGLMRRATGAFGFVRARGEDRPDDLPQLTVAGDLRAADGRSLLMKVRDPGDLLQLERRAQQFVEQGGHDIRVSLVGPAVRERRAAHQAQAACRRLFATALAMLTLLLAVTLRTARPVICIIMLIATAAAMFLAIEPRLGLIDLPFAVLLLGFGCEGALHIHRISLRGWPSAVILTTALLPLWLTPQPLLRDWSVLWALGFGVMLVAMRGVLPASLTLLQSSFKWPQPRLRLKPMPLVSAAMTCGLLIGGAWAVERMPVAASYPTPVSDPSLAADEAALARGFFDPDRVVWAQSPGETPEDAVANAFYAARELAPLLGPTALRIESPGSFVVPPAELGERRAELKRIRLSDRLEQLRATFADHGMRSAAFGEFLTGAGNLERTPDPTTALEGSLGPWVESFVDEPSGPGGGHIAYTRVHVRPEAHVPATVGEGEVRLYGPARANQAVADGFEQQLGLYTLCGLWLGALFVWLGTRQMSVALAAALAALAAQSGVLLVLPLLHLSAGPMLVPVLLLVGAAGIIAGGRACRCIDLDQSVSTGGFLLTSLCQLAAALTLMFSSQPLWREVGLIAACGSVLATGMGVFAAPGLCHMLRRIGARLQERRR